MLKLTITIVALGLVTVQGCARQVKSSPRATAQPSVSEELLNQLTVTRTDTEAEINELHARIAEFRRTHPALETLQHVVPQELSQISQAYVAAQLATIDAKAQFGPGHPKVVAAQRREEELATRYAQVLKRAIELNTQASELDKLRAELGIKQDFLRRLNDRIRDLEVAKR